MSLKTILTWHATLDDASRCSAIESLRLSIMYSLEAMAPMFDDDVDGELLYDEWCTTESLALATLVSYTLLIIALSQFSSKLTSTTMQALFGTTIV